MADVERRMTDGVLHGIDSLGRRYTSRKKHRICAQCGGEIQRRGSTVKFCSHDCYATHIKGKPLDPSVAATRTYLYGPKHPGWKGDAISVKGGRRRALRLYPEIGPCIRCSSVKAERHHKDGNTANNSPDNIEALCRRCHMEEDGRLASVRKRPGAGSVCR